MDTEFSTLLKNLPNEGFQCALNLFGKNTKMQKFSLISLQELIDIWKKWMAEFQQNPLHNCWIGQKKYVMV